MNELNEQKNKKPETRARKFWRVVFGSMLGFFLSTILVSFLYLFMMIGMIATLSKSSTDTVQVKDNSLLKIDLAQAVSERSVSTPFDDFAGYETPRVILSENGVRNLPTSVARVILTPF